MNNTGTTPAIHPHPTRRSIGALLAGMLTGVILSIGTDIVMHSTGVFPPMGEPMSGALFLLATVYRTVFGVAGSYVTARLAPDRPMQHALILGVAGLVVSTIGAVVTWNRGPAFGPHWYPLALIALALPTACLGGWLGSAKSRAAAAAKTLTSALVL